MVVALTGPQGEILELELNSNSVPSSHLKQDMMERAGTGRKWRTTCCTVRMDNMYRSRYPLFLSR